MTNDAPVVSDFFAALEDRMDALHLDAPCKIMYMEGYLGGLVKEIMRRYPETTKIVGVHTDCLKKYAKQDRELGL